MRLASTGRPQCLVAHRDASARGVEVLAAPACAGGPNGIGRVRLVCGRAAGRGEVPMRRHLAGV